MMKKYFSLTLLTCLSLLAVPRVPSAQLTFSAGKGDYLPFSFRSPAGLEVRLHLKSISYMTVKDANGALMPGAKEAEKFDDVLEIGGTKKQYSALVVQAGVLLIRGLKDTAAWDSAKPAPSVALDLPETAITVSEGGIADVQNLVVYLTSYQGTGTGGLDLRATTWKNVGKSVHKLGSSTLAPGGSVRFDNKGQPVRPK